MDRNALFQRRVLPLSRYYGILQLTHLVFLMRAGIIYLATGEIPFPAHPPEGGWPGPVIPFLLGMGAADALAAILALFSSGLYLWKRRFDARCWLISISIALSSAAVFCFGTLPSGAWIADPLGYGALVVVFTPLLPFLHYLLRFAGAEERS